MPQFNTVIPNYEIRLQNIEKRMLEAEAAGNHHEYLNALSAKKLLVQIAIRRCSKNK